MAWNDTKIEDGGATAAGVLTATEWNTHVSDQESRSLVTSGAGAPASTPGSVGDIYIDTTADTAYIATDTASSADWDEIVFYTLSKNLDVNSKDLININLAEFAEEYDNGNSGTSATIDWSAEGNVQKITLTDNVTFSFTAPSGVSRLSLKLIQDGTGSRTVTWPAVVRWPGGTAPTLSTAASSVDKVTFEYDGTNYDGVANLDFQ